MHEGEHQQEHIAPVFASARVKSWEITIRTRFYLSTYLLQAADNFQKQCDKVEERFRGDPPPIKAEPSAEIPKALFDHSSYALGAVFSAVGFLEALINELFIDAVEEYKAGPASQLDTAARQQLAAGWSRATEKLQILTKFQAALILAGKDSFDPGAQPYQSVNVLRELRNNLTHFKPKSKSGASPDKFEKRLLNEEFPLHPWYANSAGNPVFPDKCLSHGCASWALSSSLKFADEFCSRMGIQPNYHLARPSI